MDEQKLKDTISVRFKELRKKHNLSQSKFAKEIGISTSSMSSYEAKVNLPPILILTKISEKYAVSIDWLCGREIKGEYLNTIADLIQIYEEAKEKLEAKCQEVRTSDFSRSIGIVTNDAIAEKRVCKILQNIDIMYDLYKKGTISADIYNQWKTERINAYKEISIKELTDIFFEEEQQEE
ncbi:MAG: helix-turn-helix transcriptional regulator [Firmicutes bacterium]|nr:helix-turn-helix transcriptional regulator [Bacillota bacterium]